MHVEQAQLWKAYLCCQKYFCLSSIVFYCDRFDWKLQSSKRKLPLRSAAQIAICMESFDRGFYLSLLWPFRDAFPDARAPKIHSIYYSEELKEPFLIAFLILLMTSLLVSSNSESNTLLFLHKTQNMFCRISWIVPSILRAIKKNNCWHECSHRLCFRYIKRAG